jgi:PAS domain-containing protein
LRGVFAFRHAVRCEEFFEVPDAAEDFRFARGRDDRADIRDLDTSLRERAERELAMSEARFRTLSDSSPHGVIVA